MKSMNPEWLTVQEAARLLQVSEQAVRSACRAGRIVHEDLGRMLCVRRDSVDDYALYYLRRNGRRPEGDVLVRSCSDCPREDRCDLHCDDHCMPPEDCPMRGRSKRIIWPW